MPPSPRPTPPAPAPSQQPSAKAQIATQRRAIRDSARIAAQSLDRILTARRLRPLDVGDLIHRAHPHLAPTSGMAAVSALRGGAKPTSVYWRRIATALGISLDDLCADKTWQAALTTEASPRVLRPHPATLPALDTSESDPVEFFGPRLSLEEQHAWAFGSSSESPPRPAPHDPHPLDTLRSASLDALAYCQRLAAENKRLTRERDEALASLAKIRAALGVAA